MEKWKQGTDRQLAVIFFLLIATCASSELCGISDCADESAPFLMKKTRLLTKSEAGEIRMFKSGPLSGSPAHMYIALVTMEPNSLMIPHYMSEDLIIFIKTGEGKIGWFHKNDLVESRLKPGSVFRVPAGSIFYFMNTRKDRRLEMITSIKPILTDQITSLLKAFFISGPYSIFSGFDINTLTSSFNVTQEEVGLLTSARHDGSIIFINDDDDKHIHQVTEAMKSAGAEELKNSERLAQDEYNKMEIEDEKKRKGVSTWTRIFNYVFFRGAKKGQNDALDAYNVYDHDPYFKNDHGWSIEVNGHDYSPLKESDIGIFLVNLSAGSMMAPHFNLLATEYGVVTAGEGTVEVVYPNGTNAMKVKVREGDAFWVPRFFPSCRVAAREGPMEIVGFTTSAKRNRPQFLVGKNSILRFMVGKELALTFGMKEDILRQLLIKQTEAVILPGNFEAGKG